MERTQVVTWLAGIIEGEGSFIVKPGGSILIGCTMTDLDVLERIQGYVGGHIYKLTKQKQHHKQPWRWALSGLGAYELASKIAPFLLSRRSEQAHRMMDAYERSPKARWEKNRREIKRLREEGLTHEKIAQQLGLDRSQVSHVLRGRSKRSIPLVQTVGA